MKLRYERKYLVKNELLEGLRNRILPFVRADIFASDSSSDFPEYTVRSIYLDTANFDALYEKIEGLKERKKLRIRGYNNYIEGCEVFLEIKRKLGNRIAKNRALTNFDLLQQSLDLGEIYPKKSSERMMNDASKFFFNYKTKNQKPVNIVVYDREPYHGKFDPGVRITFDKNIRAALFPQLSDLYSNEGLDLVWKEHFILEIKYFEGGMPSWAKSIVKEFALKHEALSKYAAVFNNRDISVYQQ